MLSNPRGHYKSFRWTLDKLQLKPDDIFLEIGCGGGVLLNMALETVKHAKAIDHSSDMVQIAKEKVDLFPPLIFLATTQGLRARSAALFVLST